jgi:hypothetical protein
MSWTTYTLEMNVKAGGIRVRSYRRPEGAGNFREAMAEEAKSMNDYTDGTMGVLKAVERWENEGGRVESTYPALDTAADSNATAPRARAVSRPAGRREGHGGIEGAGVIDAAHDTNSQVG